MRATRCAQDLVYGTTAAPRADRVLLRLRPATTRDGGFEKGYVDAYDAASKCPRRGYSARAGILGSVALGATHAFVTRLPRDGRGAPAIVVVRLAG